MKKLIFLGAALLAGCLCFQTMFAVVPPCKQSASNSKENLVKERQAPQGIVVSPKQKMFTLILASNPTTGYSWFLVGYNDKLLKLIHHTFNAPKSKLMGAGGMEVFQFEVKSYAFFAPRVTVIKLIYARPWMLAKGVFSKKAIQRFVVVINPQ